MQTSSGLGPQHDSTVWSFTDSSMKTLRISLVATAAAIIAWRMRVPQKFWPRHPQFADFLLALVLCIVLQVVWSDPEPSKKTNNS